MIPTLSRIRRAVFDPGAVQSALIASLPMLVLLVITPAQIYIGNQPYFDHRYDVVFDLSIVYTVVLFFFYLMFRAIPWLRKPVGYPLAVAGMLLCVVALIAPSPVAELLRGRIGGIASSPAWAAFDIGILLLLWVLVRHSPEETLVRVATLFCALAALAVPAGVAYEALKTEDSVIGWSGSAITSPTEIRNSPNVYHFILDGFEGMLFGRIVSELRLVSSFDGFVWYSNAYSNYTSTRLSLPSSMTGQIFDEEAIDDEAAGEMLRTGGIVEILASNGYSVAQYNAYFINNHKLANERHSTASVEAEAYGGLRHIMQLLDLSLLLSAPQVLKPATTVDGRGLFSHVFLENGRAIADWSRNPPILSLMLFARLMEHEPRRPAQGQYVNGHFLIPHAPMVMSAECGYQPARNSTRVALVEQTMCTVIRLAEFVGLLRRLARFEDAMILVQSDHGTIRRDRPLLLVKYPGRNTEPLVVADHPVQLVDIVPTILDELGIDYSGMDGVSLKNNDPKARPEIKVWLAKPLKS